MAKKTVTQLSKDLSVDRARVMEALEKLGRSRVTTRSTVNDEEIGKIRSMLGLADSSKVKVGEERVTVTSTAEGQETVTDRRVKGTVIRRRRVVQSTPETAAPGAPLPGGGGESLPPPPPPAPDLSGGAEPPPMPVEFPAEAKKSEPAVPSEGEKPAPETGEPGAAPEAGESEPPGTGAQREAKEEEAPEPQPEARAEAPAAEKPAIVRTEPGEAEGPKVLGRIDLRKKEEVERPPRKEALADLSAGRDTKGRRDEKGGRRRKLKVIKKDVSDVDRLYRPGRYPKKRRALPGKEQKKTEITTPKASKRIIRMGEAVSVGDLARQMGIKAGDVLKKLIEMGVMATINQTLDHDTASIVASEFDYKVESTAFDAESAIEEVHEAEEADEAKQPRPPVVTVMGHVDHGKTSLLDMIRKANVVSGEAGGITQHIGAYSVVHNGRLVTFIDTPGHEAFTAMRARGAKVTDIVILVVAADDGVMPQTIEAINHAKAAKVPMVVAINKIDKPGADPERAKRELSEHGLIPEDWGGDTTMVPVSAVTAEGIAELLEMLLLQADILELKANPDKLARGIIVEAKLERGRGPVATVLVQQGTLRAGDPFVCGTQYGRVRAMVDENRKQVKEAGPATPVEILGLQGVPEAGDLFTAVKDEATAKQVAEHRESKKRDAQLAASQKTSLDELYAQMKSQQVKELKMIVKADVQGSVEALQDALQRLSTEEARINIIHASVGGVSESDVLLASASEAVVLGFNIRPEAKAQALAEREGVEIRLYRVIYEALQDIHKALEGLLEPEIREEVIGRAEVRQTFSVSGAGTIAGSFVVDGKVNRNARVRLLRDNVVVHEGKISSLKRFKDDAREVAAGYECGISLENYNDVKTGDVLEFFETQEVARRLEIPKDQGTSAAERSA